MRIAGCAGQCHASKCGVRRAAGTAFLRMRGTLFASASSIENCSGLFTHAPGRPFRACAEVWRGCCRVGAPSASRACAAASVALRWGESGRAPGYGAVGSAPALGAGGRGFKSRYPDRRLGDGGRDPSSFFSGSPSPQDLPGHVRRRLIACTHDRRRRTLFACRSERMGGVCSLHDGERVSLPHEPVAHSRGP